MWSYTRGAKDTTGWPSVCTDEMLLEEAHPLTGFAGEAEYVIL